jgi:hypothetical protein
MDGLSMGKTEKLCVAGYCGDTGRYDSFVDELPGDRGCRPGSELRIEAGFLDRPELR